MRLNILRIRIHVLDHEFSSPTKNFKSALGFFIFNTGSPKCRQWFCNCMNSVSIHTEALLTERVKLNTIKFCKNPIELYNNIMLDIKLKNDKPLDDRDYRSVFLE